MLVGQLVAEKITSFFFKRRAIKKIACLDGSQFFFAQQNGP